MVKERFRVCGKMKITSSKGDFYAVHMISHFSSAEKSRGAVGDKAVVTMVTPEEFDSVQLGIYEGYILQSGRYTNVSFENFIGSGE